MSAKDKQLQHALNTFTNDHLENVTPIIEDGDWGHASRARTRMVRYYVGQVKAGRDEKAEGYVDEALLARMGHPNKATKNFSDAAVKRGQNRRKEQIKRAKANEAAAHKTTGVGTFDGKAVANVAIPILEWCRTHGWHGTLTSGWRDPEYSRSLCRAMCGADSCPGKCAGLSSNHVGDTPARFAVDVTDYVNFKAVVAGCPLQPPIFNDLPVDPVHFSPNGH